MQTDLIIVNEYCRICHIEPSFIFRLEEGGLIEIRIIEGEKVFTGGAITRYRKIYTYVLRPLNQFRRNRCHPPSAESCQIHATANRTSEKEVAGI